MWSMGSKWVTFNHILHYYMHILTRWMMALQHKQDTRNHFFPTNRKFLENRGHTKELKYQLFALLCLHKRAISPSLWYKVVPLTLPTLSPTDRRQTNGEETPFSHKHFTNLNQRKYIIDIFNIYIIIG